MIKTQNQSKKSVIVLLVSAIIVLSGCQQAETSPAPEQQLSQEKTNVADDLTRQIPRMKQSLNGLYGDNYEIIIQVPSDVINSAELDEFKNMPGVHFIKSESNQILERAAKHLEILYGGGK